MVVVLESEDQGPRARSVSEYARDNEGGLRCRSPPVPSVKVAPALPMRIDVLVSDGRGLPILPNTTEIISNRCPGGGSFLDSRLGAITLAVVVLQMN